MQYMECSRYFSADFRRCFEHDHAHAVIDDIVSKNPNKTWNKALKFLRQALKAWDADDRIRVLATSVYGLLRSFDASYKSHKKFVKLVAEYRAKQDGDTVQENVQTAWSSTFHTHARSQERRVNPPPAIAHTPDIPATIRSNALYKGARALYVRLDKEQKAVTKATAQRYLQEAFGVSTQADMRSSYRRLSQLIHPDKTRNLAQDTQEYLQQLYTFVLHYYLLATSR